MRLKIKRMVAALLIMMVYSISTQASTDIEKIYDSKIKAIQQLPGTYVVGHAIEDFNGDGIKDLMISKVEDGKGYANLTHLCFTYKNEKMIKIATDEDSAGLVEWWCDAERGNYCPHGEVMIVSSADGKKNLLKVTSSDNWGSVICYYKVGENLKWESYLIKRDASERVEKQGEEDSYEKNGQSVTEQQYNKEIGYYSNAKMLYTYSPLGGMCSQADQYNAVNERIVVATSDLGNTEGCKYVLMYAKKILSAQELGDKRSQDIYK